jgi:hypothetical protein
MHRDVRIHAGPDHAGQVLASKPLLDLFEGELFAIRVLALEKRGRDPHLVGDFDVMYSHLIFLTQLRNR